MIKSTIFNGCSQSDAEKIIKCLDMRKEKFNTTEIILSYNRKTTEVGVVLDGTAELTAYDYDGNRMILERYEKDAIFGSLFASTSQTDECFLVATKPCEVLFFDYKKILSPCVNACSHHTVFLDNVLSLLTETLRMRADHIAVLTKRSLRGKLTEFFSIQALQNGSICFTLPFSLYTLADYLGVDRSAMQREMKRMREEGIIQSKGKNIVLCKKI